MAAMYQSPLFIEECKKRLSSLSDRGFGPALESMKDDWALLVWRLDDIRIAIEYHPYAYTINTYIDYRGKQLNVRRLYEQAGIEARERYQFWGAGLAAGIESSTAAIMSFVDHYDTPDHSGLKNVLQREYDEEMT